MIRSANLRHALRIFVAFASLAYLLFASGTGAHAAPVIGFQAGSIIDDGTFTNYSTMSPTAIQNFLNSKVPNCDTNGQQLSEFGGPDLNNDGRVQRWEWGKSRYNQTTFPCLKNWKTSGGTPAAQVIYNKAVKYKINPQVLIVLLQKEQGLVTDTWPLNLQYKTATGYGCPDTAPCDSQYYGLANQLDWAAKMFRAIMNDSPTWYTPYTLGVNRIYFNPDLSRCGYTNVTIENRATQALYNYTPYQPNQAALNAGYGTGNSCSAYGNRNFYLYFTDWFGKPVRYYAFKGNTSAAVYLYLDGMKLSVPSMSVLQDYGFNPSSIRVFPQAVADGIPLADTGAGYSTSISYLAKSSSDSDSDGSSLYFVTLGKRFRIVDLTQYNEFGFSGAPIAKLPIEYIKKIQTGGNLANFIGTPSNNVFKVEGGAKNVIFSYSTYQSLNSSGSLTRMSHGAASEIAGGDPVVSKGTFIRKPNGAIAYYDPSSGNYHSVPNLEAYNCWGVGKLSTMKYYQLARNDYIASYTPASSLGCYTKESDGTTYLINQGKRHKIPASFGLTQTTSHADINSFSSNLSTVSHDLSRVVKSSSSSSVWYIESGAKRPVPSMHNLALLGFTGSDIDMLSSASAAAIPTNSAKKLGSGQIVKTPGSGTVWVIDGNKRYTISSASLLESLGYKWKHLETYSASFLDSYYPVDSTPLSRFISSPDSNTIYYFGPTNCYVFDAQSLTDYNVNSSTVTSQPFTTNLLGTLFNLSTCQPITSYAKSTASSAIYKVEAGTKYAFTSWQSFLDDNTSLAPITVFDPSVLSSLSNGTPI